MKRIKYSSNNFLKNQAEIISLENALIKINITDSFSESFNWSSFLAGIYISQQIQLFKNNKSSYERLLEKYKYKNFQFCHSPAFYTGSLLGDINLVYPVSLQHAFWHNEKEYLLNKITGLLNGKQPPSQNSFLTELTLAHCRLMELADSDDILILSTNHGIFSDWGTELISYTNFCKFVQTKGVEYLTSRLRELKLKIFARILRDLRLIFRNIIRQLFKNMDDESGDKIFLHTLPQTKFYYPFKFDLWTRKTSSVRLNILLKQILPFQKTIYTACNAPVIYWQPRNGKRTGLTH